MGLLDYLREQLNPPNSLLDRKYVDKYQEWQPEAKRVGGQALEAPMFSPDDLIGTGIPSKLATLLAPALKTAAVGAAPLATMGLLSKAAEQKGVTTVANKLAQALDGQAGMFLGKGAKTADLAKLAQAESRIAAGDDAAKVWAETGWGKGPDGHWRFEIPDNTAHVIPRASKTVTESGYLKTPESEIATKHLAALDRAIDAHPKGMDDYFKSNPGAWEEWKTLNKESKGKEIINRQTTSDKLGILLDHDPVYAAYDSAYDIPVELVMGRFAGSGGEYSKNFMNTGTEQIGYRTSDGLSDAKSGLIHELQHAIQQREGFARGGSPENAPVLNEGLLSEVRKAKKELGIDPYAIQNKIAAGYNVTDSEKSALSKYQQLTAQEDEILSNRLDPYDAYKRLSGEAEARLTQSRMSMDASQRAAQYPWEADYFQKATGVPLNGLLFRYD